MEKGPYRKIWENLDQVCRELVHWVIIFRCGWYQHERLGSDSPTTVCKMSPLRSSLYSSCNSCVKSTIVSKHKAKTEAHTPGSSMGDGKRQGCRSDSSTIEGNANSCPGVSRKQGQGVGLKEQHGCNSI